MVHGGGVIGAGSRALASRTYFGDAKVEDLGLVPLVNQNVCSLDVAVDNAGGVGRVQDVGDFNRKPEKRIKIQRAAGNLVCQGYAVDMFHDDEGVAVLLPDVMGRTDVRVIQCGGSLCLALEAGHRLRILGNFFRQELDRDKSVQARVFSLVDHAHPAAAQLFDNAVMRNGLADHWRESYVCETGKSMKAVELPVSLNAHCGLYKENHEDTRYRADAQTHTIGKLRAVNTL